MTIVTPQEEKREATETMVTEAGKHNRNEENAGRNIAQMSPATKAGAARHGTSVHLPTEDVEGPEAGAMTTNPQTEGTAFLNQPIRGDRANLAD